jgi:hypothetical protein
MIKHIYSEKGIKGFYAGSIPNMGRNIVKGIYRYPMMISMPIFS